jgi:hypothetical protein
VGWVVVVVAVVRVEVVEKGVGVPVAAAVEGVVRVVGVWGL